MHVKDTINTDKTLRHSDDVVTLVLALRDKMWRNIRTIKLYEEKSEQRDLLFALNTCLYNPRQTDAERISELEIRVAELEAQCM